MVLLGARGVDLARAFFDTLVAGYMVNPALRLADSTTSSPTAMAASCPSSR